MRHQGLERISSPRRLNGEECLDETLRPRFLDEFIGQTKIKDNLRVYIWQEIMR